MQYSFTYNKAKVIQALRFHFISRREIKLLMILVNVFAITSAILFFMKKIRPEPFLLGALIWLVLLLAVWYFLPYNIYKKTDTFLQQFTIHIHQQSLQLSNNNGIATWAWNKFESFTESPHFFHLYFSSKSFFLIPKDDMGEEFRHDIRAIFNQHIKRK